MSYEEPTCVLKMLNDFRAGNRLSSIQADGRSSVSSNYFKLNEDVDKKHTFGDVNVENDQHSSNKKIKLDTKSNNFVTDPNSKLHEQLIEIKNENISLRGELKFVEGKLEETELRYKNEKKSLELSVTDEKQKVKELEKRVEQLSTEENKLNERLQEFQNYLETEKNNFTDKALQLQRKNALLQVELEEARRENRCKDCKETTINNELESLKEKLELNEKLVSELRDELNEKNKEITKLEIDQTKLMLATKRLQDLEYEKETFLQTRAYVESQNKKLLKFNALEKEISELKEENNKLKSNLAHTLYLESVIDDLRSRQAVSDVLQEKLTKLQQENHKLSMLMTQYDDVIKNYCDQSDMLDRPPLVALRRRLDELTKKELLFVSEKSELELINKSLAQKSEKIQNKLEQSEEQINKLKETVEEFRSNMHRMKKQLHLVKWERDDLRSLIDSWYKDTTLQSVDSNQVELLQKVIDNCKQRNEEMGTDPNLVKSLDLEVESKLTALRKERDEAILSLTALKKENQQLTLKIDELNDQLEYRALKGDFDPRNTKIVHMRMNPISEAVQNYENNLDKAKEEINKLRERIKLLEEGNTQDVTRLVDERVQTNSSKEIEELQKKLKSQELQYQRLCEVFKERCRNFRDAVYMLFGYKVDLLSDDRYRVLNLYADDPKDFLLFQMTPAKSGTIKMLETSYSRTLGDLIDLHLKQHDSIPLFLSSLTTELYNKQTMVSNASVVT